MQKHFPFPAASCFLAFFLIFSPRPGSAISPSDLKKRGSLYGADDGILDIRSPTFSSQIYERRKTFLVEFYSSWCGGCLTYASKWKMFAKLTQNWNSIVEVGALNCALQENTELCRIHDIDMFPTIKYFKYGSRSEKDGSRYEGNKFDVLQMRQDLAGLILRDWLADKPENWPDFAFIEKTKKLPDIWTKDRQFLAVIFDDQHSAKQLISNFSAQLILDWVSVPKLGVVSTGSDHTLARGQIEVTPGLAIYKKGDMDPIFVSREKLDRLEMNEKIVYYTNLIIPKLQSQLPVKSEGKEAQVEPLASTVPRYEVHIEDLISGLSYMIQQEIPLKKKLAEPQLSALKAFLGLLTKYFPGTPPVRRFLFRLNTWLNAKNEKEIPIADWLKAVDRYQEELGRPLPTSQTWVACQGSQPQFRGYPCSLWTIFHTITVQAYKSKDQNSDLKALEILNGIHGYIRYFFGCEICAFHFGQAAEKLPEEIKKDKDLVLWLWKTHNRANRITDKPSENTDPKFPRYKFPTAELCQSCRDSAGEWRQDEILKFLLAFYSDIKMNEKNVAYSLSSFENGKKKVEGKSLNVNPKFRRLGENVSQDEKRELEMKREMELLRKADTFVQEAVKGTFWNWNRFDLSFCLILWAVSVAIIAVLCFYFRFRKQRHKYYKSNDHRV